MRTPEEIDEAERLVFLLHKAHRGNSSSQMLYVVFRGVLGWLKGDPRYSPEFEEMLAKARVLEARERARNN